MNRTPTGRRLLVVLALAAAVLCGAGCAGPRGPVAGPGADPWEPFNRKVFAFNEALDDAVLQPAARGYEAAVPELLRSVVGNMFSNIGDLWVAANQLMQGKPKDALADLARFAINTVCSLGGMADVATSMGLEKHREDFGQTLGRWGVASGPYLVLPLFGPSSMRDAPGLAVDLISDPMHFVGSDGQRNNAHVLRLVDARAGLLRSGRVLEGAALDKYSFLRDSYLQRRRSQVFDGDPPPVPDDDDVKAAPRGRRGLAGAPVDAPEAIAPQVTGAAESAAASGAAEPATTPEAVAFVADVSGAGQPADPLAR